MALASPLNHASTTTATVVALAPEKRRYTRLVDAICEAGCELLVLAQDGLRSLTASREPDARADAHVDRIDRVAYLIAQDAQARGDTRTLLLAGRIRSHCQGYRVEDAAEDRHVGLGAAVCERLVSIARGLNTAITRSFGQKVPKGRANRLGLESDG